jgi:methyl-accepting chemotaxis protein
MDVSNASMPIANAALDSHLRLDEAIGASLQNVIADTESSAMAIMAHVRGLHDSSNKLIEYLNGTSQQTGNLGAELLDSVAFLGDIGSFIRRLRPKMERDLENVQAVVQEIKELGGMAEAVQSISLQSHMLGINAAIEASRAGDAGASFAVIAVEMRKLAKTSGVTATGIAKGLARARQVVEEQMKASIAESSTQLDDASRAADVIEKLRENFEDMSQFYKTRFAIIGKHNGDLSRDIAETLGQIQYQDVVRQCIERAQNAIVKRNESLKEAFAGQDQDSEALERLPEQLSLILDDYLAEEDHHKHSTRQATEGSGERKIELF